MAGEVPVRHELEKGDNEAFEKLIPFKKTKRDPYSTYLSFLAYTGMLPNDTGKSRWTLKEEDIAYHEEAQISLFS